MAQTHVFGQIMGPIIVPLVHSSQLSALLGDGFVILVSDCRTMPGRSPTVTEYLFAIASLDRPPAGTPIMS